MKKQLLLAAMISTGLAFAPAAMAQSTGMDKPGMKNTSSDKMMDKKTDAMTKPADDKMQKTDGTMDKKDSASDKMKK